MELTARELRHLLFGIEQQDAPLILNIYGPDGNLFTLDIDEATQELKADALDHDGFAKVTLRIRNKPESE